MQSNMQAVNALASFVSRVFCWKNKAELLFWSLLYRSLILETNLQCVIWKYSGNSFFSFQQKTSPPRKKACKIRPNPTRISPTFLPLISTSVSPSCSLQLCKLSFKHTHTWHEPARAPWNLEKYYLYSLLLCLFQKSQAGVTKALVNMMGLHVYLHLLLGFIVRNTVVVI